MTRPFENKGNHGCENLLEAGLAYIEGGINLIPVNAQKTPADPPLPYQKWKRYQKERVTKPLLRKWANTPGVQGWAMVCGKISGSLTILDFDEIGFYERWKDKVGELALTLPTQQTGSGEGYQVAFRSNLPIRNDKLAYAPTNNAEGRITAIETRGEGGYAVVAPSYCPEAVKRGKKHRQPYRVIQGDFAKIPTLSDEQSQSLLETAQSLDEMPLS
ncbi:MAG: bifunctional DNA primase/polymerase, partial [Syntrophales bacterium LBB04]|nr:bifunctional DNA primase/polymerase [Syntrophales bacterium LBB04]